ncbi:MAG: FAD-dependent thymidylate synthase [Synergistetes bacterium]|nr:FAD-dependent thymidylate synthase [Synergistota bacterium]MDW8192834.1 FAD-dependent thymidylate synthase [Synergistota bacterium]
MRVKLLNFTPNPDFTVYLAARVCYSKVSIEELEKEAKEEKVKALIKKVIKSGHHSVLEHASFTFGVEGVSRVTTHQLVRHRIASYSQQSLRWVNAGDMEIIIPPSVSANEEALKLFEEVIRFAKVVYAKLVELGIPKEDARFLIPQGVSSEIIFTMNARELHHFFRLRLCSKSQWEIRKLAYLAFLEVRKVAPIIFEKAGPPCITEGRCLEEKPCGNPPSI